MNGQQKRRGSGPHHKNPRSIKWTAELDAMLRAKRAEGLSWPQITRHLDDLARWQGGRIAAVESVRRRAIQLGIIVQAASPEKIERVDCRAADGSDPLLAALLTSRLLPPRDARPSPADGMRLNWRALQQSVASAGSAAALCAEG